MTKVELDNLIHAVSFAVDSGQAMVGDPCYLDQWKTDEDVEWNLEGKEGQYTYQGASATTISNDFGELGLGSAVVFNTGYGDGYYPVYVQMNDDGRVSKVVIDFEGELEGEDE
jgi:hypothetical protein